MTPLAEHITTFFSLGIVAADLLILVLVMVLIALLAKTKNTAVLRFSKFISDNIFILGFLGTLAAFMGSLVYSNIIGFVPCEFCWWQRIFMYPLVILFGVGLYQKIKQGMTNTGILAVSLIMSVLGGLIALYHSYAQLYNPSLLSACEANGVSCSKLYFVTFGYITIPTMSLTIFLVVLLGILVRNRYQKLAIL